MVDDAIVHQIKERTDIADTIGQYVTLKRRGSNLLGLCPFHNEKTPSFTVNTAKNIWHCFGCGEGGNVFQFIMKIENLSFPETLKMLGERAGMSIDDLQGRKEHRKEEVLFQILLEAQGVYRELLSHARSQEYIAKRGLSPESLQTWNIGYTGPKGQFVASRFKGRYSEEQLIASGLFISTPNGLIDRFQDRLMFPILDLQSRVVGFGGRTLGDDPAKYINSPETPIYHKSNFLYGLQQTKQEVKTAGYLILVEGYMDAVGLYQSGIKPVAAVLGTALTIPQIKMAERFTDKVFLCFDADEAGRKAARRAAEVVPHTKVELRVISLKGAKDPDEFVAKFGSAAFDLAKEDALPLLRFLVESVVESIGPIDKAASWSGEDKAHVVKEVKALLSGQDEIVKSEYVTWLAKTLHVDADLIKNRFFSYGSLRVNVGTSYTGIQKLDKYQKLERGILGILLSEVALRTDYLDLLPEDDIEDIDHKKIIHILRTQPTALLEDLMNTVESDLSKKMADLVMILHVSDRKLFLEESLNALRKRMRDRKIDVIKQNIKQLEKLGDFVKLTEAQNELSKLKKIL